MAKTKTVVKLKDGTTTELSNLSSAEIKELVKLVKKKRKVVGDDGSISSDSVDDLPLINKKQKTSSSSGKHESGSKSKKVESTSKVSSAEKKSKSSVVARKTTVSVKDAKTTSTSNPTIQNKTCRESAKKSSTLSKKKDNSGNVAMGNKHNGDSPMGSKQSSKSQSKKATISLLDSDDEKKTTGSRKIPRKKTLLKNSPSQKSICGTVSAQPDTPHPHSLNDDHTQSPSSMSNGSGRSCHTEVAEFSEESLSDGQKMSFPSQTGRHNNTSFESIITNLSNDKGMNDTYFEVSRI